MIPGVYIIILNWNGWKDTIECLESVFKNGYPNYKVVVVDNGSSDGSLEKIKAWADGKEAVLTTEYSNQLCNPPLKKPIPYVYYSREEAEKGGNPELEKSVLTNQQATINYPLILIQSRSNLGFPAGNNVGIRYVLSKSRSDYIMLLNNDIIVTKDFLVKLISFMQDHSTAGVAGPKIIHEKGDIDKNNLRRRLRLLDVIFIMGIGKALFPNNRWQKRHRYTNEYDFKYPKKIDIIAGACILFKTKVLNNIGLLDENTFLHLEEFILHEKLRKTDWETWIIPGSEIIHKGGKSISLRTSSFMRKVTLKSLIYYLKNYRKINNIIILILISNILLLNSIAIFKNFILPKSGSD